MPEPVTAAPCIGEYPLHCEHWVGRTPGILAEPREWDKRTLVHVAPDGTEVERTFQVGTYREGRCDQGHDVELETFVAATEREAGCR